MIERERLEFEAKEELARRNFLRFIIPVVLLLVGVASYLFRGPEPYRKDVRGIDGEMYCEIFDGSTVKVNERGCFDGNN